MTEETVLLKSFKYYDLDNSGYCNPENFMRSLIKVGINIVNEENLHEIFGMYDINNEGYLNYKDFVLVVFDKKPLVPSDNQSPVKMKRQRKPKKQMINENKDILAKIRNALIDRGTTSIVDLSRCFKIVDDDNSKQIEFEEFKKVSKEFNFGLNEDELQIAFDCFDEDNSGAISYEEFVRTIRGSMNPFRKALVQQAFDLLDKNQNGVIEMEEMIEKYNVSRHPDVLNGKKSEKEVFEEFADSFQVHHNLINEQEKDNEITIEEFMDYYEGISMSIDKDEYFELMMNNAWKMNSHTTGKNNKKGWSNKEKEGTKLNQAYNKQFPSKEQELLFDKLRKALFMKGARGFVNIIRLFKKIDENNSLGVDVEEFVQVVNDAIKNDKSIDIGNSISQKEIRQLFELCDTKKTGIINYVKFISDLHNGELNDTRKNILNEVFDHLDTENLNEIDIKVLKSIFEAPVPNPIPDLIESLEIYHNIVRGTRNPLVSRDDFLAFYNIVSFLIPSDQSFITYVSTTWRLGDKSIEKLRVSKPELGKQKAHIIGPKEHKSKAPFGTDSTKTNYITSSNVNQAPSDNLSVDELIEMFRKKMRARGVRGIMSIRRTFMLIDENDSKTIEYEEFCKMLTQYRILLSDEQIKKLFSAFDKDNNGSIDYEEFISAVEGEMSSFRTTIVKRVYDSLVDEEKGYVTLDKIRTTFNPKECPLVREGKKNEEEVLSDFIDLIEYHFNLLNEKEMETDENGDIIVSYEEFLSFYKNISMSIEDDKYFEVMCVSEWGLDIDGKYPYQKGWNEDSD